MTQYKKGETYKHGEYIGERPVDDSIVAVFIDEEGKETTEVLRPRGRRSERRRLPPEEANAKLASRGAGGGDA